MTDRRDFEAVLENLPPRADRRRNGERRISGATPDEDQFIQICALAGCRYVGIQRGLPGKILVLFNDSRGSTLALPPWDFSFENVKQALREADMHWEVTR